jgi:hypothetical protein
MNYQYFISYKRSTDTDLANNLGASFAQRNIKCFVDSHNLAYGKSWLDEIKHSIIKSEYMIALFTPGYIEQVEKQGEGNIILQELELAVSQKKLIPIVIGVSIDEMLTRCSPAVAELKHLHCLHFDIKSEKTAKYISFELTEQFTSSNDEVQPKQPMGFAESLLIPMPKQSLIPEEAYHKFDRSWSKDEALQYKEELEKKSERTALENTVLAKFYLSGRFDIRIDPEMAMNLLLRTNPDQCKYTLFEIGKVFYYGDTVFGYSDKKAIDSFKKADNLGYYPATILLASLFEKQCNKTKIDELKTIIGETEHSYSIPAVIQHDYDSLYERGIDLAKGDEGRDPVTAKYWQAKALFSLNKDHAMAKILLQQSAESSIGAKIELAWCLLYSEHFQRDIDETVKLLQSCEDMGLCRARNELAKLHLEPLKENESFIQVPQLAVTKLKQNIALGYHDSTDASAIYSHTNLVLKASRDNNEIESSLLKAIEAGHYDSRAELGYYYCYEWEKKNEALNIWSKAASIKGALIYNSGYVNKRLATLYLRNEPSEALDIDKAEYHAIAAFFEGEDMSKELLEIAFLKDNLPLAYCWFQNGDLTFSELLGFYWKWRSKSPFQAYAFLEAASQGGHVDAMYVHLRILNGSKLLEDDTFNSIVSPINPKIKLGDVIFEKFKQVTDLSDEKKIVREREILRFEIMKTVFEAKQLTCQPLTNANIVGVKRATEDLLFISFTIGNKFFNFKDEFSIESVRNDLFMYLKPTFEDFSYYAPLYYDCPEMSVEHKVERLTKLHEHLDKDNYKNKSIWSDIAPYFVILLCTDKYNKYYKESWYRPLLRNFIASSNKESRSITHFQARIMAKTTLFHIWKSSFLTDTNGLDFCLPGQLANEIQKTINQLKAPEESWNMINLMPKKYIEEKILRLEKKLLEVPD